MADLLHCKGCEALFLGDPLLQAEMKHIALTQSPGAATAELRERLAEEHAEHG